MRTMTSLFEKARQGVVRELVRFCLGCRGMRIPNPPRQERGRTPEE